MSYWLPVLFVLFLWWFSTGAIIYLNNLPSRTYKWSVGAATVVLIGCVYGLFATRNQLTPSAGYLGFAFGLLAWAWTQLTFYTGYIAGPRKTACRSGCAGIRHFWHAVETSLYHEGVAALLGLVICVSTIEGVNHVGTWTYTILWLMHLSAKLNAVFGVRNLNEHFFPDHLRYLGSFLKQKPMNLLFPVSITVSTAVTAELVHRALAETSTGMELLALIFYITLLTLGVMEHWFLVLPIPADALWNWSVKAGVIRTSGAVPTSAVAITAVRPRPCLRVVAGKDAPTTDGPTLEAAKAALPLK